MFVAAHPECIRHKTVIELGAGTGVVGLAAACLGAASVVLTDLPTLVPLMSANIKLAGLEGTCSAR